MIEAAGIPHTEVSLILVNGQPQSFAYHVQMGDDIGVYPAVATQDLLPLDNSDARFVADVHLGRLAAYLRMIGFDTRYPDDYRDEHLAELAASESRILLTRDFGLLKRKVVVRGYYIPTTQPWAQLADVLHRFNLVSQALVAQPRCTACNGTLNPIDKEAVQKRLQPNTLKFHDEFRECSVCGKVYWRGSHYARMTEFLRIIQA